ncbi:hypothetical protein Barb6_01799 [Bacteroidales bacterium Barb6]|nr:hypothetical protein Barb6_01799 [Bacteroidales bacterium Barb6]
MTILQAIIPCSYTELTLFNKPGKFLRKLNNFLNEPIGFLYVYLLKKNSLHDCFCYFCPQF